MPAAAQTTLVAGADVTLSTAYVWRGVARRNGRTLLFSPFVALSSEAATLTAGWWTTLELSTPDPVERPTDVGTGRRWFGENDLWIQLSGRIGAVTATAGMVRYGFARPETFPAARLFNTSEMYGRAWVEIGPVVSELSVWYDFDRVDGAYVETGGDLRVPTLPSHSPIISLYLTARTAWSIGQQAGVRVEGGDSEAPGLNPPGYFRGAGFAHADVGFRVTVGQAATYVTLEGHALLEADGWGSFAAPDPPAAPAGSPSGRGTTLWWWGLSLSRIMTVAVF